MSAPAIAKLLKKRGEPTLSEVIRLMKDRYGDSHLELEVELDLKPETGMGKED